MNVTICGTFYAVHQEGTLAAVA